MRRRFLALGCAGLALAGAAIASQGCGADAVGLCDFNECVGADGGADGALLGDATGQEGSVVGPSEAGDGSPTADGGDGGVSDAATPSCGDASAKYCGADAGCVDTATSLENCGACGNVCPGPTAGNGTAMCGQMGCTIQCAAPQMLCQGACVVNSGEPASDPCVVSTSTGVFVAPSGVDTAAGTEAAPVKTIAQGVALAKSGGLGVVYVCDATYAAALSFAVGQDGVKVYGGLVCPGTGVTNAWTYEGKTVTVAPPAAGATALTVSGLVTGMTFEDFVFQSSNATGTDGSGNGESSIAVAVENAAGVVFKRVTMVAGNGAQGSGGTTVDANAAAQAPPGNAPVSGTTSGGVACAATCPNGSDTQGGQGGDGSLIGGGNGDPGLPSLGADAGVGGAGQTLTNGACTNGSVGASGTNGNGGDGSLTLGSLSASGWTAGGTGSSGAVGETAQGGGGGGGGLYTGTMPTGGGGGGGCGGCGGGLGTGGAAGGASIALMSVNSTVSLTASILTSAIGGSGGQGGAGVTGQTGGIKGPEAGNGCSGGPGGNGGAGGGGGGGAGGSSFDLAYTGTTAPTLSGTTLSTSGSGGLGGQPGTNGATATGTGVSGAFAPSKGF